MSPLVNFSPTTSMAAMSPLFKISSMETPSLMAVVTFSTTAFLSNTTTEFKISVIDFFIGNKKQPPATMKALNELTKKIESDKDIASKCGQALAHYKKVKSENEKSWVESINEAQLNLGLKG
jgi:hypothetical protein